MTQSQGEMRETYPATQEPYRYRLEEGEGHLIFDLEGSVPTGLESTIALSIESREAGGALCRTESGRFYRFAWAWVGPELHLWLDGLCSCSSGQRPGVEGAHRPPKGRVMSWPPCLGRCWRCWSARVTGWSKNQTVVLMESMKMELVITASRSGVVRRVAVEPGQQVERGMRLLELAPENDDGER